MRTVVGVRSDVGKVREGNEDSYLVEEPVFAVADGMGGHIAGDVASQTAVDTIRRADPTALRDGSSLEQVIKEANSAIWNRSQNEPDLRGMGTTCTLILVDRSQLHIGHVGDSRAYLFRDDELSQLTEDHTLVGRMVKEGRLRPEDAEHHPQRSIITRALGVDPDVQVDLQTVGVLGGDSILICSDGLTSMIDADAIAGVLREESDPQAVADRLVALANEAGGEDNITVVIVSFREDGNGQIGSAPTAVRERTATTPDAATRPAPPAPPAVDTGVVRAPSQAPPHTEEATFREPVPAEEPARRARGGGRAARAVIGAVLIVGILLVAGFLVFRYVIVENSYFVGADGSGRVAIYQGLPEDVAGFTFKEEHESTSISVTDLPSFLQGDVEAGIKAQSLDDARVTVNNLEQRARDEEFDRQRERRRRRDREQDGGGAGGSG